MHLHTLPRYGMPARAVLAFLLLIGFCSAAEPTKVFDVPPGEAAQTLKRYASQAGREIVFAESVGSVPTNAVKGELTPREALDVLLADTGLVGTIDAKTGAIAIRRETLEEAKNGESRPATSRTARSDGPLRLDEYEVIGLRDTGLVNEGVIPRRENEAIPYIVFDRLEIERSGATDLNEVLRSLPQVAAFQADTQSLTAQRGFATFGAGVTAATRVDLRGFGTQGTTILVNGRHMPLVRETQGGGPDISRIPLTAIDRIEVLPGSAGGIYGTNTMGGVINIVLKKNYAGRDLTLFYGMAAAGGANEVGLTYIEGRTLFGGRANLTWTFDARKREPLYYEDRPLYRRFLERNVSPMNGGSVPAWIAAGGMVNFVPRSGVIVGGTAAAFAPLNIPGATGTVNFASVPLNQNGSNLTPASFLGTANQMTVGEPYARFALYNPTESYSLNVTYNHELKKDRLFAYAELGLGYTFHEFQTPPQPQTVNLTATNPRNPFRTGVVPGYPGQAVRLFYLPADLPGTLQDSRNGTARLVLGMNGQIDLFGRAWKWAVDTSGDYNYRYADGLTPMQSLGIIQNSTVPAAIAYYNIFADHAAFPNTAAANSIRASSHRENSDFVWLGEVTVRANGELIDLPGGTARASFVASGREQKYENDFVDEDDGVLFPSLGIAYSDFPVPGKTSRQTAQVGGELVVPVLGRDFRLPGAREFDLVAAYSRNSITDAKPYGTTNFGLRWAPMADVNFRASFGRGTYPPNDLASFTGDAVLTEIVGATTPDPRRGNSPIGTYTQRSGGNPDLHPESTRTINLGLILQPRRLKGLSATFDYGYIEKKEGIQTLPLATLLANEAFYPERITRAAPTAADAAVGWAGQITQIDVRRTNIGNIWSQYLDTSIRYYLETSTAGNFNFIFRSTNTREYRIKLRPESPITDTLDQISSPLHFRGSGSVAWRKGAWTVTPAFVYIESFRDALNVPVDDSLSINLQLTYEIPASTLETVGRRRWLAGTQWTIGCNNIADAEPPYVQNPGGQSIAAYYSTYDDPRGRYFYVRVRKSL